MTTLNHPEVRMDLFGRPRRILRGGHNQCPGCGEFFNSSTTFERHRVDGTCLTTEQMQAKGMTINADGFWIRKPREVSTLRPQREPTTQSMDP